MAYEAYIGIAHGNPYDEYSDKTVDFHTAQGDTPEAALKALLESLPTVVAEVTAECEAWEAQESIWRKEAVAQGAVPQFQLDNEPDYVNPRYFARMYLDALKAMDKSTFQVSSVACEQITYQEEGYREAVVLMITDAEDPYNGDIIEPEDLLPLIQAA